MIIEYSQFSPILIFTENFEKLVCYRLVNFIFDDLFLSTNLTVFCQILLRLTRSCRGPIWLGCFELMRVETTIEVNLRDYHFFKTLKLNLIAIKLDTLEL